MNKTKIEWCDCTINPVVGCQRGCSYCYARKLNDRFKWIPDFSKPQFFPERLKAIETKTPRTIFMNSMSDWVLWNYDDFCEVMDVINRNPQHNYIFLTKCNCGYMCYDNIFSGRTITRQPDFEDVEDIDVYNFLSIEPILAPIILPAASDRTISQIIIGAETGNRKGKIIPPKEWIDSLVKQADSQGLKVFMKNSLIPIVGEENMRRELIWRIEK